MNTGKRFKTVGLLVMFASLGMPVEGKTNGLLDTLVQKGYLTQEEAEQIAKGKDAPVIKPAARNVQSLTISGRMHLQYDYISQDDQGPSANPAAVSQFLLRRVRLGVKADLGGGWSGFINADFSNNGAGLSDAIVTKEFEGLGAVVIGYQKVSFGNEENTSSARLKTVERSPATNYWSGGFNAQTLGFGARHIGIFWKGEVPGLDGLRYGLEMVNSQQGGSFSGLGVNNQMGYYWNVSYAGSVDALKYKLGVNMGYQPELSSVAGGVGQATFGWNPYVELNYGRMNLMAEMLGAVIKDGKGAGGAGGTATPIGINVIPSYMVTDQLEIAFRYSYLRTNGRGVMPSQAIRNSPNPLANAVFNVVDSFYIGGIWYIRGNDVKITAGYEHARFSDRGPGFSSKDGVNDDAIRVQLQLLF